MHTIVHHKDEQDASTMLSILNLLLLQLFSISSSSPIGISPQRKLIILFNHYGHVSFHFSFSGKQIQWTTMAPEDGAGAPDHQSIVGRLQIYENKGFIEKFQFWVAPPKILCLLKGFIGHVFFSTNSLKKSKAQ